MSTKFYKTNTTSRGALLLELLVVIALLAVIVSVVANGVYLSMRSNKSSAERSVANALGAELMEATRSAADENWQNIYGLTKATQHYYATSTAPTGKWTLIAGDETVTLNGIAYTRYITINNVSRDSTTRNILTTYASANDDPSTQLVTANVSWSGGAAVTFNEYFLRWKNKSCAQSSWTTGGTGNTVQLCSAATYDVKDAGINVTGGLHLQ